LISLVSLNVGVCSGIFFKKNKQGSISLIKTDCKDNYNNANIFLYQINAVLNAFKTFYSSNKTY